MLADRDAMATIAVKDMNVAARFYEGTLGFRPAPDTPGALVYQSGKSTFMIYQSRYAGTNEATVATWAVDADLEHIVRDLAAKGVRFEHYDLPGTTLNGDIHLAGGRKMAWLKDPDSNILALTGR